MSRHHLVIFTTGGITLALELLASRILAPYFGVSLYIWTGILSITLVALAVGYWWGGRLASGGRSGDVARLSFTFALMPSVSSLSILVAALLYPKLFVPLANFHLVIGSFVACGLLLLVPLVAVSAMNPLLVALSTAHQNSTQTIGDAGAGWVFFVSTLGSVLGVLVTAFVLVPNITNFRSLLLLAIALALLAGLLALSEKQLDSKRRRWLLSLALVGGLATTALLAMATKYLQKDRILTQGPNTFRLVHEEPTFFGNIKVVDTVTKSRADEVSRRFYLMGGIAQCVMYKDGRHGSGVTYGMESLGRGFAPNAKRILVLGLAGGVLPMRFSAPGVEIDMVEINPASISLAERFFGYDPHVARHYVMDARVYVRECRAKYDLIFADLFHGDSTPEYLLTAEFMADLAHCLAPQGGVIFNMVGHSDDRFEPALYSYVKTASSAWPHLLLYHGTEQGVRNMMILASAKPLDSFQPAKIAVPKEIRESVRQLLLAPRHLDPRQLEAARPLTDDSNVSSIQHAWIYLETRRSTLEGLPPPLLVN